MLVHTMNSKSNQNQLVLNLQKYVFVQLNLYTIKLQKFNLNTFNLGYELMIALKTFNIDNDYFVSMCICKKCILGTDAIVKNFI